ncbi:Carboxylesterase family [Popillia japonica]|uniref:Carboxylic ester hydrolase n=1 Tax=Popillia japonica TaxID=7064 RepID=A0AAW1ISM6_POPJA
MCKTRVEKRANKTRVEKRAKVNEVKEEAALVEDEDEFYIDSLYRTTTSAVYSINMQKDTMWIQKVQINNKIIDFKLNTGAEINVLPLDVLNSITGLTELTPSNITTCEQLPIVNTSLGKLKGFTLTSRLDRPIYSFIGIRYAKAPIDELRFQPPVPVDKWNGVYDATQPGPVCPQRNNPNSSEDCLMLNVYTNKLPANGDSVRRPVMIFFHPGGFYGYTGAVYVFGPQYLLDEDIVLVTANYRLGSLGFLSTGTKEAPGNNGFKDQVVVLKWIRDHIQAFGGNPNMVTISGYSAGAFSTNLHLISPMSRDLFHRAIIMSSSVLGHAITPTNQFDLAQKQARLVNCTDDTPANIINCLKTKTAQEIAAPVPGFREVGGDPVLLWRAVIEPDFGQERFLVEHPITSALYGRFAKVPVMIGITEIEFGFVSHSAIRRQEVLDRLSNDYKRVLPIIFSYERETNRSNEISTSLKRFYFGDGNLENTTITMEGIEHLYADGIIGFRVNRATKLISAKNTENTYYYCFTYRGRYSYFYLPDTNNTETAGAVHHDDLIYLFYISNRFPYFNSNDPEWQTVNRMVKMWTNFVKSGNPTPDHSTELNNVHWVPYSQKLSNYMEIGNNLVMKQNLYEERYQEWEKLFPLDEYL